MRLRQRIVFTVGALIVYRFASYIPLPGIDPSAWDPIVRNRPGYPLGIISLLSGGGLQRIAIFAIGILPYVSAAILVQFVMLVFARRTVNHQGYRGRQKILNWTRGIAIVFTVSQASALANGLQQFPTVVPAPGPWFEISTILTLTAGTMFLVWLADQITLRGVGNGLALILTVGILAELPAAIASTLELGRQGALPAKAIFIVLGIAVALVGLVVFMESARRHIAVEYSKSDNGSRAVSAPISLKLNASGIMPLVLVPWLLWMPTTIAMMSAGRGAGWIAGSFSHGRPLFLIWYVGLILAFASIYVALLFDRKRASAMLETRGGKIPGVLPGPPTADYLGFVVSRIAFVGGLYLAFICIVPEVLIGYYAVPFYLGGSAFLIVVCAIMDLAAQYQQQARLEEEGYRQ